MKSSLVSIVIVSVLAPAPSSAAGLDGPLMRAAVREAGRLSAEAVTAPPLNDWSRVVGLAPAADVDVTLSPDPQPLHRIFVWADDAGIVLLNVTDPTLPKRMVRALKSLAEDQPQALAAVLDRGSSIEAGPVRVNPGGVFEVGRPPRKVADVAIVLMRIPRRDIAAIDINRQRGPKVGAAVGATLGVAAGFLIALETGVTDCRCSGKGPLIMLTVFGVPIGGGILAYQSGLHTETTAVYRTAAIPLAYREESRYPRLNSVIERSDREQTVGSGAGHP